MNTATRTTADGQTYNVIADSEFAPQDRRVTWKDEVSGRELWAWLYTPSAEALSWDGVEGVTDAIGLENLGIFSYVELRATGRKLTAVHGSKSYDAARGMKAKLTFVNSDDENSTVDAWIVD